MNNAFIIGIVLNSVFVLVEACAGFFYHSLALLTDAGHNLGDVAGLLLVVIASRLAKRETNEKYTYGYGKSTVVVALLNALILLVAVGAIGWEAIGRIASPHPVEGRMISIVALIGIIINTASALLFLKGKEKDINIKGAYLHMAADALVSAGVLISGIIIVYTQWYWVDAVISLIIIVVIVFSTMSLLRSSLRLSLDGVPAGIDTKKIRDYFLNLKGVTGLHDLHIWAMSTNATALTVHLVIPDGADDSFLVGINDELHHQYNIDHTTIQVEKSSDVECEQRC